tara:strand:+ start:1347 stop:1559 length:213 start_codon:yes stop_codon:yes gene_type:complete
VVKLYLIGWAVVVFATYGSVDECLEAEKRINAREYYYEEFDTLCLEISGVNDIGGGSSEHKGDVAYIGIP